VTIEEITQEMVNPEQVIEPQRMALIIDYISGWIIDKELELLDWDIRVHNFWGKTKEENAAMTVRELDVLVKRSGVYRSYMECRLTLSRLRSYRETLKRRLNIISGGFTQRRKF
jgi:hypothetical protein